MSSDSGTRRELDRLTQSIMDQYRRLTDRLRAVKSDPESKRYQNQVDKTERELRGAIQKFQELEAASRREMEAQMQRQARIAFPDATDAEIAQMVNSETQIFQQAVLGSRGERANRVLGLHKERKQQMEQIERQLEELLDLMSRVQEMLVQDEVKIQAIETTTAEAATKLEESNVQLESAVASSRGARRKKFICLGICGSSAIEQAKHILVPSLTNKYSSHCRYHRCCRGCLYHGQPCSKRRWRWRRW